MIIALIRDAEVGDVGGVLRDRGRSSGTVPVPKHIAHTSRGLRVGSGHRTRVQNANVTGLRLRGRSQSVPLGPPARSREIIVQMIVAVRPKIFQEVRCNMSILF